MLHLFVFFPPNAYRNIDNSTNEEPATNGIPRGVALFRVASTVRIIANAVEKVLTMLSANVIEPATSKPPRLLSKTMPHTPKVHEPVRKFHRNPALPLRRSTSKTVKHDVQNPNCSCFAYNEPLSVLAIFSKTILAKAEVILESKTAKDPIAIADGPTVSNDTHPEPQTCTKPMPIIKDRIANNCILDNERPNIVTKNRAVKAVLLWLSTV